MPGNDLDWDLLSPLPKGEGAKAPDAENRHIHIDIALEVNFLCHQLAMMGSISKGEL